MRRLLPWLAVCLGAVAVAVAAASIVLLTLTWHTPRPEEAAFPSYGLEVADRVQFAFVAVIGAFIAARRPRHPIGWLAVVGALGFPLQNLAEAYARYALDTAPGALPGGMLTAWGSNWLWTLTYPVPALLFLLFPTGRPPSRRWRPLAWVVTLLGVSALLTSALYPGPLFAFPERSNPLGVNALGAAGEAALFVPIAGIMVCFLLGAVSLVLRFRRGGSEERAQIKWLLLAAGLFVLFIAGSALSYVWWQVTGAPTAAEATPMIQAVASIVVGVALSAAIAVAILRYRLYDIDLVISRTVGYVLLTAFLGGVYVSGVVLLGRLLAPLTTDSDFAIAGATLAAAVVFAPARRRIQAAVDRRFNRIRYDAQRELEAFRARLRDDVELEELRRHLVRVTGRTVEPAQVSVWLAGHMVRKGATR